MSDGISALFKSDTATKLENMTSKPKYSIVVPIYNDAYLARALCEKIRDVFNEFLNHGNYPDSAFELIFVNDGSANDSLIVLLNLIAEFDFIRVIDLSRNFGQHVAISCGYRQALGDVIIRMNVDMQDSPSYIPMMIREMSNCHADLVVGQYSERQSTLITRFTAYIYFSIFGFLTGISVPQNTSSLRVMSRRFIDAYNSIGERSPFPQGIDQWLGFNQTYVPIEHSARIDDKSSYTFRSRLKLAVDGILYFSDKPIRLVTTFGFCTSLVGLSMAGWIVFERMLGTNFLPGYASLLAAILFAFGFNIGFLGLIGLYVGKIFQEVKNRPQYLIREIYEAN